MSKISSFQHVINIEILIRSYVLFGIKSFSISQLELPHFKHSVAPVTTMVDRAGIENISSRPSLRQGLRNQRGYLLHSNCCVRKHDSKSDLLITVQGHFLLLQEGLGPEVVLTTSPKCLFCLCSFHQEKESYNRNERSKDKSLM